MLKITKVLINNAETLTAVDKNPFFTLHIESDDFRVVPTALILELQDMTQENTVWRFEMDPRILHDIRIPETVEMKPHRTYQIRFRIEDSEGGITWSRRKTFYFAYPTGEQWSGHFLSADCPAEEERGVSPVFRFGRDFSVSQDTVSAHLYITAMGLYKPFINGRQAGNDVLTPGWFSYDSHLGYQVYDIFPLLRYGENQMSILLGDGWYKGYLTSSWHRNYYGNRRQLLWEIHLRSANGTETILVSDKKCRWKKTPILMSEIYSGEICDMTEGEDDPWKAVLEQPFPQNVRLHTSPAAPAHYLEAVVPERILTTPNGETVVDFGRVISGVVELTACQPRGTVLLMEFGDTLGPDGNFYNENVELFSLRDHERPSVQKVRYTFAGNGMERYRPTFTYQCFRYMRISGTEHPLGLDAFMAYPISSFTEQTGTFHCGDRLINQIFENTLNTERATFLDIPVAGPMRAERLGWTGDNQLMFPLAMRTMFDSYRFLGKWLEEVRCSQGADGQVGTLAPYVNFEEGTTCVDFAPAASAIWGDAATICPWLLYEFYGDKEILVRYRDLAKGYVDYMRASGDCETTFTDGETFGDWFALDNGESAYPGKTDKAFLGNVYYYRSTDMLCRILHELADPLEAEYTTLAEKIRRKINSMYFQEGKLTDPTQAGAALVLAFGIADAPEEVAQQLCGLLEESNGSLLTGFTGTSVILHALCQIGRTELAVNAVARRGYPSWIYTIEMGATTIWEHFNGIRPDGSYWDPNMNSFCHLTFGSVVEWFYSWLLGIRQQDGSIGYERILIDPVMSPGLSHAEGGFDTIYGRIHSAWACSGNIRSLRVKIPFGTQAQLVLRSVREVELVLRKLNRAGYSDIQVDGRDLKISLGWGTHSFKFET